MVKAKRQSGGENKTLGTPIAVIIKNTGQKSEDYKEIEHEYRPGHADKTTILKYGIRDHRGGGRSSGRETVSRVIAGYFAGLIIPNHDNGNKTELIDGAYAIEPFATTGQGLVYDSGKSGIYRLERGGAVRDSTSRKIYQYILEEFQTLPFCERWITKKFGSRTRLALLFLEKAGILHQYAHLVEKSHSPVSQAEHTIIVKENPIILTKI